MTAGKSAQCPCLLIAAPASGSGKTTVTAALARWHTRQGRRVRVFKAGPDFIDPMILRQACGCPVYSLDLGLMSEEHCRALLHRAAAEADLILVEGVMGLFDGTFSAALIARTFDLPVAVIVDARAMAETFAAVVLGLTRTDPELKVWGCIANRVASPRHGDMVRDGVDRYLGGSVPWLGAIPANPAIGFAERHLGLVQAREIQDLDAVLDAAADTLNGLPLTEPPPVVTFSAPARDADEATHSRALAGKTVAVAQDAAFSFVYAANLDFLREQGAELVFTSPLGDRALPACDVLYLPGGYPELHARELEENRDYIDSVRAFGGRILAECGGMIYLSEAIILPDGGEFSLCGLLPLRTQLQERLQAIGWQHYTGDKGKLLAHSFHYSSTQQSGEIADIRQAQTHSGQPGEAIYRCGGITASYLHWYFPSNPAAAIDLLLAG